MQRFTRSYAAIGVTAFFLHLIAAFVIGMTGEARFNETSDSTPPVPLVGGFEALGLIAFLITIGFVLRVGAYVRLGRAGVTSRALWWAILIGEAAYVASTVWIVWVATEPVVDAGYAALTAVYLAIAITIASVIILIVAILVARNRKAKALAH